MQVEGEGPIAEARRDKQYSIDNFELEASYSTLMNKKENRTSDFSIGHENHLVLDMR